MDKPLTEGKKLTEDMMDGRDLTAEQVELLRRAVEAGLDLVGSRPTLTPDQIIQAAIDPPNCSLRMTDETTDEELFAFIEGKRRGCHY